LARPNAANDARTTANIAAAFRIDATVTANREFMITVSNWNGFHSQARDAEDFSGDDVDKQWRRRRIFPFRTECCSIATCRPCLDGTTSHDVRLIFANA
jgi:hypothetical protein